MEGARRGKRGERKDPRGEEAECGADGTELMAAQEPAGGTGRWREAGRPVRGRRSRGRGGGGAYPLS